jgi:hypothetical protein
MTGLTTQPQVMSTAAADVAKVNSAIGAAKSAAAGPTTAVLAAAQDEVSAAAAKLFGSFGQEYQALLSQATAFHDEFAAALGSAAHTYSAAEAANAAAINIESLLGFGPTTAAAPAVTPHVVPPIQLNGTTFGLIIGGSGLPVPPPSYVSAVLPYVNFPTPQLLLANAQAIFTPEGLYPLTGIKSLPFDTSVSQGLTILDTTIKNTLAAHPLDSVTVLGYSQSADIASLEMRNLANPLLNPNPPTANQLSFTLLGDQMAPNGGIFARFPGFPAGTDLSLPSLGITFLGATPSDTIYHTNIFTLEYDGYADFPRYPLNVVSDLNAFAGIAFVHGTYPTLDPANLPPGYALHQLPTSPGYTGVTNYYEITTPNGLPLLQPLREIPLIGNPIADLLQPDLTTIVNLGYGDPAFGYSTAPADVQTYFGLFPHVSQALIAQDLITGAHQGVTAFVHDIQTEAGAASLGNISHTLATGGAGLALPTLASLSPDSIINGIQTASTNIANQIATSASNAYSVLLPTADIVNALATALPSYDLNLVLSGLQQAIGGDVLGGLQYALVAPFAADTALITMAGGFELLVLLQAAGISL